MEWDEITERKFISKIFAGGADLTGLKAFVAQLPDALPENTTAEITLVVVNHR